MKILVTGHMGLLGRHLARSLKGQSHEVHGCDIRGGTDCRETFKVNNLAYDLVIHAARPSLVTQKMALDADFFDWTDRAQPKRAIYLSSTDVYPAALQGEPYRLTEEDAEPDSPEGWVYLTSEKLALERGFSVFRPFSVYGEKGTGEFESLVSMVKGQVDPFRPPGCGQVLDFIHVDDAVQTVLKVIEGEDLTMPLNLCTGVPTAVDELALAMCRQSKWEPKRMMCQADEDRFFRCGDVSRMKRIHEPTISLAQGIGKYL